MKTCEYQGCNNELPEYCGRGRHRKYCLEHGVYVKRSTTCRYPECEIVVGGCKKYCAKHSKESRRTSYRRYNAKASKEPKRITYLENWREDHREEIRECARKWIADHPEKAKDNVRAYQETDEGYAMVRANSSRNGAVKRDAVIDPELISTILAEILLDTDYCEQCKTDIPDMHDREIDHKLAIVFGGEHSADNIQILCKKCHKRKSSEERSLICQIARDAVKADPMVIEQASLELAA